MEQQSKKTMRHFYCRDVLWETFEKMANDFDCSIDYLVNESMSGYAKLKDYPVASSNTSSLKMPQPGVHDALGGSAAGATATPPSPSPPGKTPSAIPASAATTTPDPVVPPDAVAAAAQARPIAPPGPPPSPHRSTAPMASTGPSVTPHVSPAAPPLVARPVPVPPGPPPRPSNRPASIPPAPRATPDLDAGPKIFLRFNNQRYVVDKDQFIIGRGSKSSDLPIKDGNISRKHAAVIRRNGSFYIKDLGSTNGIDYKGMRIDNKRIDEGDIFFLCDYELKFSYEG